MYNSTERTNKMYKVTSGTGNIQTNKTNTYKTVVKKVLSFMGHDIMQFSKTTHNYFWQKLAIIHALGTYTIFMNKF